MTPDRRGLGWGLWKQTVALGLAGLRRVVVTRAVVPEDMGERVVRLGLRALRVGGLAVFAGIVGVTLEGQAKLDVRLRLAEETDLASLRTAGRFGGGSGTLTRQQRRRKAFLKLRHSVSAVVRALEDRPQKNATEAEVRALFPDGEAVCCDKALLTVPIEGGKRVSAVRMLMGLRGDAEWMEEVLKTLNGMDEVAPGVSGVRVGHLKQMVSRDRRFGEALAENVDRLLMGEEEVVWRTVRLCVLPKARGGWRPLGCGEACASIAKRLLLSALSAHMGQRLRECGQWQAETDACRGIAKVAQAVLDRGGLVWGLDVKNAFGSVDRGEVVGGVRWALGEEEELEGLVQTVAHGLGPVAAVTAEGVVVPMTCGVVQGDAVSMLTFGAVVARKLGEAVTACVGEGVRVEVLTELGGEETCRRMAEGITEVAVAAFADDVTILAMDAVKARVVRDAVERSFAEVGMKMAPAKEEVTGVAALQAEGGVLLEARVVDCMRVLGVPVGSDSVRVVDRKG